MRHSARGRMWRRAAAAAAVVVVVALMGCVCLVSAELRQFDIAQTSTVLIKTPKAASSTAAGVVRRMGKRHGLSGYGDEDWIQTEPGVWANHGVRKRMQPMIEMLKKPYILVTTVRDPVERCFSAFYHFQVFRPVHDTMKAIAKGALRNPKPEQLLPEKEQLAALQTPERKVKALARCVNMMTAEIRKRAGDSVQTVLRSYDLVIPADRIVDGFLLLAYQLGGSVSDVLFLASKNSSVVHTAKHTPLDREPAQVQNFVRTRFTPRNRLDELLVKSAQEELDAKLAQVPPAAAFPETRDLYVRLLTRIQTECANSVYRSCLWKDNGCGQVCIDMVVDNLAAPEKEQAIRPLSLRLPAGT